MATNPASKTPDQRIITAIRDLQKQMRAVRSNQNKAFVIPAYASDPTTPVENQMWRNTTTDQVKIVIDGVKKIVTLS